MKVQAPNGATEQRARQSAVVGMPNVHGALTMTDQRELEVVLEHAA